MSAQPGRKAGVILLGAAVLSLLFPKRLPFLVRRQATPQASPPAAPPGAPLDSARKPRAARPPRRMWALVQLRPETQVLAVSVSRTELERELAEINATWNHCELRDERQRYVIQPAPVLYPAQPEPGPRLAPAGGERSEG